MKVRCIKKLLYYDTYKVGEIYDAYQHTSIINGDILISVDYQFDFSLNQYIFPYFYDYFITISEERNNKINKLLGDE